MDDPIYHVVANGFKRIVTHFEHSKAKDPDGLSSQIQAMRALGEKDEEYIGCSSIKASGDTIEIHAQPMDGYQYAAVSTERDAPFQAIHLRSIPITSEGYFVLGKDKEGTLRFPGARLERLMGGISIEHQSPSVLGEELGIMAPYWFQKNQSHLGFITGLCRIDRTYDYNVTSFSLLDGTKEHMQQDFDAWKDKVENDLDMRLGFSELFFLEDSKESVSQYIEEQLRERKIEGKSLDILRVWHDIYGCDQNVFFASRTAAVVNLPQPIFTS